MTGKNVQEQRLSVEKELFVMKLQMMILLNAETLVNYLLPSKKKSVDTNKK